MQKMLRASAISCLVFWTYISHANDMLTLRDIQTMDIRTTDTEKTNNARIKAVRNAAFRLGAQTAYAQEMARLERSLTNRADELDHLYDFAFLMRIFPQSDNGAHLLPPSVRHMSYRTNTGVDGRRILKEHGIHEIEAPARLVSEPPNWRAWLILAETPAVGAPHRANLPKKGNKGEYRAWKTAAAEGWDAGEKQAKQEMIARMQDLKNAYTGRVRYLRLLLEGKISAPEIEGETINAHIDGGMLAEMTHKHTITKGSAFAEPDNWRAFAIEPRSSVGATQ